MSLQARFWAKVDRRGPRDCWNWTAAKNYGYGILGRGGRRAGAPWRAHRLSWEMHRGPIPAGLWVLHRCDNRACVNPGHLFLGTVQDNNHDCVVKGRHVDGERAIGRMKLTKDQVLQMRAEHAAGTSQRELERRYGVHYQTVHRIVHGKRWGWLRSAA